MTTSQLRRTFVALSAATVLALAGCGEEEPTAETTATPADSESPTKSHSSEHVDRDSGGNKEKSQEPPAADGVVLEVTVSGGEISPMAQAVEIGVGEPLVLRIDSDRSGELHVHSTPEQMVEFASGTSRHELTFDQPGSVDVEEHESGALVARVLAQ